MYNKIFNLLTKLTLILAIILISFDISAASSRTVNIVNNCPFTVLWVAKGTVIKDNGAEVTCPAGTTPGTDCFNNKGSCGQSIGGGPIKCYFKYPTVVPSTVVNDNVLESKVSRQYRVDLIDRTDPGGVAVTQYSLNFVGQTDCSKDPVTNLYICNSAPCGERLANGRCAPDRGVTSAFTQAEITFNEKQNDFYDISIINGVNIPISITPMPPSGGIFGKQHERMPNFFCKTTGGVLNSNYIVQQSMRGCSWQFTPPAGYAKHIFTEISNKKTADPDTRTKCLDDAQCATATAGKFCGLSYPDDYKNYADHGFCGNRIAYQTLANISPLVSPAGIPSTLNTVFNLRDTFNLALSDGSGTRSFTNNQLFMCETTGDGSGNLYLDSCYQYCVADPNSASGACSAAELNKKGATACCGCTDWSEKNIPTDQDNLCSNTSVTPASYPPACTSLNPNVPLGCRSKPTTKVSNPIDAWKTKVKPLLSWLIDGCSDAYEYQYGDKHGTMQCSSLDIPSLAGSGTGGSPTNNINYIITFCPSGKGIFDSAGSGQPVLPPITNGFHRLVSVTVK